MSETEFRPDDAENLDNATGSREDEPVPEADVAEQRRDVREGETGSVSALPYDVDPADAAEQNRVVEYDEDDYR